MERKYETYVKVDGKWIFVGWGIMLNEEFCIETKKRGKFIYKIYKWSTGVTEEYRYGSYIESKEKQTIDIDFHGGNPAEVVYYTKHHRKGGFLVKYDTFRKAYDISQKAFNRYDFITGYQIN